MTQTVLPAGIAAASDIIPVVPGPSRTCVCYCSALLTIPNIAAKECDCPDGIHFANIIHYVVPNSCLQSQPDAPDDGPWYVVTKGKVVGVFNNLSVFISKPVHLPHCLLFQRHLSACRDQSSWEFKPQVRDPRHSPHLFQQQPYSWHRGCRPSLRYVLSDQCGYQRLLIANKLIQTVTVTSLVTRVSCARR
jgi:hypothetical protein